MRLVLIAAVVALAGCRGGSQVSPPSGPQFGHFRVAVVLPEERRALPLEVRVGSRQAYDLALEGDEVSFTVQGDATPGPKTVTLIFTGGDTFEVPDGFKFTPPPVGFERVVAFGASFSQGDQSAGLTQDTQLQSPVVQVARQAGADLPQALVRRGLLDGLRLSDFDERCALKGSLLELVAQRVLDETIPKVTDRRTGEVSARLARVDPEVVAQNVAIGGSTLAHVLEGPVGGSPIQAVMEHVTWDLVDGFDALTSLPQTHQIDRVEALAPTLLLSADLLGNDAVAAIDLLGDRLEDPARHTSPQLLATQLEELFGRLEKLGAKGFFANVPPLEQTRQFKEKLDRARARGRSEAAIRLHVQQVRTYLARVNVLLDDQARRRPWVHVVDVERPLQAVLQAGFLQAGPHRLETRPFGGLLSLDHFHFSNSGYAFLANLMVRELNAALGTSVPEANLVATAQLDPFRTGNLVDAGLTCAAFAP